MFVYFTGSLDQDGYRAPKMKHRPRKTRNRSRNPITQPLHYRLIQAQATGTLNSVTFWQVVSRLFVY